MKQIAILSSLLFMMAGLSAQGEFSGGFKTGLNFSNINGPTESSDETFEVNTGFHIGATFVYSITDLFGLKGEFMYSQKGTQYGYDGESFFTFFTPAGGQLYATGNKRIDISVSNSYIDIPIMVYYRIGIIEVEAGVNGAVLVGSRGSGGVTFSGQTPLGDQVNEFTTGAEYGYFNDNPGPGSLLAFEDIALNGLQVRRPVTLGAYYHGPINDTKKYKRFDYGLNAGISVFVNKGLFVGVRANYGLADITNDEQDVAQAKLNADNSYELRSDDDKNLSIQASIGFRF